VRKVLGYKIVIGVLLFIIILQWLFILRVRPPKAPALPPRIKGKIAIVLDDWGYNLNNLDILNQIKYPLTCSILPNLNYTTQIAQELNARGYQIILHLPMEPHEKYSMEKNTVLTSMDEETIRKILEKDLAGISYARGVSNHMGSRATEDTRVMGTVLRELKNKKLYFLDSFVSSKSICSYLAKKIGASFARRDIFLDNTEEPAYIKSQLYKLKMKARSYGRAIGIGHDRKVTLEVLREVMPQLEREGYKFVFVSELVK
jgi:polysaccharide deacetylase 2 family uncharacterized protein YibQ